MPRRKRKRKWYSSPFWRSARNAILIAIPISMLIGWLKLGLLGLGLAIPVAILVGFGMHMYDWWADRPR